MTSASAVIKKKRISKKNKTAWRKHSKIADVEQFLEEKRLDERFGFPTKAATGNLFRIDTKPKSAFDQERKKNKFNKAIKGFSVLSPHTNVPDPIIKRNRVKTKEERKSILVKNKENENARKGILKSKQVQSVKDKQIAKLRERGPKRGEFKFDVWSDALKDDIETDQWLETNTKKHNLIGAGKVNRVLKTRTVKKTSHLPSIETPHPGTSYNPSYKDHQSLLRKVADKEIKVIQEERHLNRVSRDMFSKITPEKRDEAWIREMLVGLPQSKEKPEKDDDDDDGGNFKAVNPPVKNVKKTIKQRKKQQEQNQIVLQKQKTKLEKKKITDIHQIKLVKKSIEKEDSKIALLQEKREKMKMLKNKEVKRLGKTKFEEPDLDFNMGKEISGNLRNLNKQGNILVDRFKSLQKRNMIQPSVRKHHKKGKVKVYTKPGHKENWKKTVAKLL